MRRDGPLVGHPQDRPAGALAAELEHARAQRGKEDGCGRDVGDVERVVDPEHVVLDVDGARAAERLLEHVEVGAHGRNGTLVGKAEHLVDDPVVRHAEAEREAPLAHGLHGQRLLRERDRMAGLHGHHRGADLDPLRIHADDRRRGEGVELVGDLRDPHRRQPRLLGPAGVGPEPIDLRPVAASLRADHQADAHREVPSDRMRTLFFD